MDLNTGTRLGAYEILAFIGAGGMGEVYRARDTKLGRDVAIKVLPEALAEDKDRLARFEREARLLASLNHSNIATIHGLEKSDGVRYLVMELVEGETLAEQIAQGPIPLDEALPLFGQIAEGLEAAHEKGVVHRDLKPANIKITTEGKPKILDFGLAKVFGDEDGSPSDSSQSPTLTKGTALGTIMGTASYMSPEQARGKAVDKRADIWSFGCCLHEALTAKKAFGGATVTDTLAAVVKNEPDWNSLPAETPDRVRRLLHRCLRKSLRERLRDIGDARLELLEAPATSFGGSAMTGGRRFALLSALAAVVALAVWGLWGRDAEDALVTEPAVVVLMDTPAPAGVYDSATLQKSGTNADDLSDVLSILPVVLQKETLGSRWDREDQVLKQDPDLILIHRSAFFHSMNIEMGFGYPPFSDAEREAQAIRLYSFADDKLGALLGYIGIGNPRTKILVYSRGTGGGWPEEEYRRNWVVDIERRFPALIGRVFTMVVPGGTEKATFRDPATARVVREHVRSILRLDVAP